MASLIVPLKSAAGWKWMRVFASACSSSAWVSDRPAASVQWAPPSVEKYSRPWALRPVMAMPGRSALSASEKLSSAPPSSISADTSVEPAVEPLTGAAASSAMGASTGLSVVSRTGALLIGAGMAAFPRGVGRTGPTEFAQGLSLSYNGKRNFTLWVMREVQGMHRFRAIRLEERGLSPEMGTRNAGHRRCARAHRAG